MCCSSGIMASVYRKVSHGLYVLTLVITNVVCLGVAGFFGMLYFYETTNRLPYLTQYTIHHWINIFIIIAALLSQCVGLLVLYTVACDKFNFARYQKLNPSLIGFGVIFLVFGIMDLARYIGMNITNEDLLNDIRNKESPSPFLTKDGFQIPLWFDYYQRAEACCGVIDFQDYDGPGKLNGTQVDANRVARARHGIPATCCKALHHSPSPACGEQAFGIHIWEQRKWIFQEGCGRLIAKTISDMVYIGMSLCLLYALLCFAAWFTLRFILNAAIRELGMRTDRAIKSRYNYADGYLSHLQNIYMDVAVVLYALLAGARMGFMGETIRVLI